MCLESLARHECGCTSKTTQGIQECSEYQLMEDLKALGYAESHREVKYCRDVCAASSREKYVNMSGRCASCSGAVEVKGLVAPISEESDSCI